MPVWLRLLVFGLSAYLLVCAIAFLVQRRLLYFPDPTPFSPSARAGERSLESVSFRAADGALLQASWWPGTRHTAVLLFHGNAGNRASRVGWMEGLHARGWPILLLDYRGYGGSEGRPTESGFALDADAARAWLVEHGHPRIAYLGSSIGCGVAVGLAARHAPAGLILQSGAVDLAPVAKRAYPFLPMGILMRDRYDVRDAAASVKVPALCIHGDLDEFIPLASGRALHDALGGPTIWWDVEGAGHNDVVAIAGGVWYDRVHAFLERLEGGVPGERPPPAATVK